MKAKKLYFSELIQTHKKWVFDCDGVVLDSNKIKTTAFFEVTKKYGHGNAIALVRYHTNNGGISRFKKFEWFLKEVVGQFDEETQSRLCLEYGQEIKSQLMSCNYTDGFLKILDKLNQNQIQCFVVSGGFEEELHEVFKSRGIYHRFNGVFGSPIDKSSHLKNIQTQYGSLQNEIFWGDAKADYLAATEFKMRFVFLEQYSEALEWSQSQSGRFDVITNFTEVLE